MCFQKNTSLHVIKGGHMSDRVEFWPFLLPAPHPVGLKNPTRNPDTMNPIRWVLGFAGWVLRVGRGRAGCYGHGIT